jgi:STE24 endopeptidase
MFRYCKPLFLLALFFGLCTAAHAFDAEQATQAWLATQSTADRLRSDAYFEGGYWLLLVDLVWALVFAWFFMGLGASARLRDRIARFTRRRWLADMLYIAGYVIALTVISLPLNLWEGYFREHDYGLSNQSLGQWFTEGGTSLVVAVVFMAPLAALIWAAVRRSPRHWWLWGSAISTVFLAISIAVVPVFVAPLFNDYKPLPDSPIRSQILSMARANGVPATEVYEFDASRQSTRISANVSGLFGTERVSLNDNLLKRTTPAEVRAVMGHEIGHYTLNHGIKLIIGFGLISVAGFAFIRRASQWALTRYGARWRVQEMGDIAVAPVVVAAFTLFMTVITPLTNTMVRSIEQEADYFGLNAAREPDAFARVALRLSEYRKINPSRVEEIIFFDHPSGATRIRTAMRWKAEHLDENTASAPPSPH